MDKRDLTLEELLLLNSEMRSEGKLLAPAYIMLIGGHMGIHRFYLNRHRSAVAQLVVSVIALVFYFASLLSSSLNDDNPNPVLTVLFFLFFLATSVWVFIDIFLIPKLVRQYNAAEERQLIERIVSLRKEN